MRFTVKTDVGVVRSENQDRAAVFNNGEAVLAILCDGMGGHNGGSHASTITISVFERAFMKGLPKESKLSEWFSETLKRSTKEMTEYAQRDQSLMDMGTTVTAAILVRGNIYIFNVGDSRTYAYNGLLHQITRDHNLWNHYIDKYGYTPEEAARVTGAAALTSALGPTKTTKLETFVLENDPSLKYLVLTSDGVHDYVSKPNFEAIVGDAHMTIEDKGLKLITQAIRGKSSDNCTVVIVEVK